MFPKAQPSSHHSLFSTHFLSQLIYIPSFTSSLERGLLNIYASSDSSLRSDSCLQLISEDFSSSCVSFRSKHFKRQNHPLVYTSSPPPNPLASWCPVPPHYRPHVTSLIREKLFQKLSVPTFINPTLTSLSSTLFKLVSCPRHTPGVGNTLPEPMIHSHAPWPLSILLARYASQVLLRFRTHVSLST